MIGPKVYRLAWKRRLSRRYRTLAVCLAIAVILGGLVPTGLSTEEHTIVTGHSTFFNGDAHDPCLAAIVGIMRLQVLWFNDQVLVERYNGDGSYLYVTEANAPDPREEVLVNSGVYYDFVDPNGVSWHVREAYWEEKAVAETGSAIEPTNPTQYASEAEGGTIRYYTWIVQIGEARHDAFSGDSPHTMYNFVTLVNTCKFQPRNFENTFAGNETHEAQNNTAETGHKEGKETHDHETWDVDLWVGEAPDLLPAGEEAPNWVNGGATTNGDGEHRPPAGRNPDPDR